MIKINIHEAKTHLSQYLDKLGKNDVIVLCKRNKPIAEVRPVDTSISTPRPVGLEKGRFEVESEFFEPLPKDILEAFSNPR